MNQKAIEYVQHQLLQGNTRLKSYVLDEIKKTPYPKRNIFIKTEKYINDFIKGNPDQRWIIIPGLRGVGKTTILAQIYFHFLNKPVDNQHIIYISLDEVTNLLDLSLKDVLEAYEQILGISFEKLDTPIILLIDEVQYDPKWAITLKVLWDKSKKICILCSGSSAVSLQTNPDVIRRAVFEKLYPVSFTEFLMIKHSIYPTPKLKKEIKEALYNTNSAKKAYELLKMLEPKVVSFWSQVERVEVKKYLEIGTLPFAIRHPNPTQVYESINFLLDKIISQDIQSMSKFDSETLGQIKRLLYIIAGGDTLSINKLTQLLPLNYITIANIFDVLEKAELLIRVRAHGSNISEVKKPSKYLFMTPAIRLSLLSITGQESTALTRQGKILEDIVALHFYREFVMPGIGNITNDSSQESADFILQIADRKQLAIEIGVGDKDLRQVITSMEKIKCNYGIIFSSGQLTLFEKENIVKVPLDYFLLM